MGLTSWLKNLVSPSAPTSGGAFEHFIYVKIPEDIGPLDRGSKYEDPIEAKLGEHGLGEVSGGGSLLGVPGPDGARPISYCGIDVDTRDIDAARMLLRDMLPRLGAPDGTELHYEESANRLKDVFRGSAWTLGQPRDGNE